MEFIQIPAAYCFRLSDVICWSALSLSSSERPGDGAPESAAWKLIFSSLFVGILFMKLHCTHLITRLMFLSLGKLEEDHWWFGIFTMQGGVTCLTCSKGYCCTHSKASAWWVGNNGEFPLFEGHGQAGWNHLLLRLFLSQALNFVMSSLQMSERWLPWEKWAFASLT